MSWEHSREHAEIDAALRAVRAARPPISGKLVGAVVEVAIKHAKYYKGIVYELERFLRKARAEYRIPAFYLINAVCHAAKTKLKDNKDQYVKRFMEKGMPGFESLSECDDSEKQQIAKVLTFWVDEDIFPEVFVRKLAKATGVQLDLKDDGPSIQEQLEQRKAEEAAAEAAAAAAATAAANPPPPQQMDPRRAGDPRAGDPRAQHQLLDVPPGIAQRGPPGWAFPRDMMPVSMGPPSQMGMNQHDPRGGPSPPGAPPQQYGQPPPPQPNGAASTGSGAPPPPSSGKDDQFYDEEDDDDEARREAQRKLMEAQAEQVSRAGPGQQYLPPPVMSQIQQQQQQLMQQQMEAAKQNQLMQQQRGQPPPAAGGPGGMQQQVGFGQRSHQLPSKEYVRTRKVGPGQKFEEVRIPSSSVGLIIGKQGSTIKNLQSQSGAFIQTQRDTECAPGATEREVYLVGNDQQLTMAKQMIQDIVDNDPQINGSAPPGRGGRPGGGGPPPHQQHFGDGQGPPTSQRGDPGNWMCQSCGNENWPKRMACNRCQMPKPAEQAGPPPDPMPAQGGGGPPQPQQLVEMPYVDSMLLRKLPDKPTAGPAPGTTGNAGAGGASSPPAKRSKWS